MRSVVGQDEILGGVQRRKRRRAALKKWGLAVLLLTLLLAGAVYGVLASGVLVVSEFEVRGARLTPEGALLGALADAVVEAPPGSWLGKDNLLTWLFAGDPALRLGAFPALESFSVTADIPDRKVIVEVREREALGVWCGSTECFAFDKNGVLFSRVPEVEGALILKVRDESGAVLEEGRAVFTDLTWMERLLGTLAIVRRHKLAIGDVLVRDLALREWEVRLRGGPALYFSFDFVPENLEGVLEGVGSRLDLSKLTYLDFRVPNRVYYK